MMHHDVTKCTLKGVFDVMNAKCNGIKKQNEIVSRDKVKCAKMYLMPKCNMPISNVRLISMGNIHSINCKCGEQIDPDLWWWWWSSEYENLCYIEFYCHGWELERVRIADFGGLQCKSM